MTAVSTGLEEFLYRAKALHRETPLIDGHNDLPWQYRLRTQRAISGIDIGSRQEEMGLHTDIPRLREGGVGGQFWSVYVNTELEGSDAVQATMEQIDVVYNMIRAYPETFGLALTADRVEEAFRNGKIASLIGMEGGHSIGGSIGALRMFHRLGARYMTLTHNTNVPWADSCTDAPSAHGLTDFGREVVREMNRLGMMVDLSHVSAETMHDALDASETPVIFSHSSARAIASHPRNVPDDVLSRVPENDGVVMVTFVSAFVSDTVFDYEKALEVERQRLMLEDMGGDGKLVEERLARWQEENPKPKATIADVADHIDHIRDVAGINHVGIGGDFDGTVSLSVGLEDVSGYHLLTAELIRREYQDDEIRKILGENVLRVMREVESASEGIERGPSEMLLEEGDQEL